MMGNKAYYANRQLFNSSLISRKSKLQIYRTLVRPVVTYGLESWTLTMEEERALAVFERKIFLKIYGPVIENELWRTRQNDELEAIIRRENIVRFIKLQRIRWLGHIDRMQDTAIPKKDAVRKAVCNKTKRKTKNEMAG
jgi:wyosine [tRNA(Phe)-imidazoG37] synthetase (radical SAM superfamily)